MEHKNALAVAGGVALLTLSASLGLGATYGLFGFAVPKHFGPGGTLVPTGRPGSPLVTRYAAPIGGIGRWASVQPPGTGLAASTRALAAWAADNSAADQMPADAGQPADLISSPSGALVTDGAAQVAAAPGAPAQNAAVQPLWPPAPGATSPNGASPFHPTAQPGLPSPGWSSQATQSPQPSSPTQSTPGSP